MVYVLADIHGMEEYFDSILQQIDLKPEDTLYILGDVADRGLRGISILRRVMQMPNVRMILGNHEYMMLQAIEEPSRRTLWQWYRNGGHCTHDDFRACTKEEQREMLEYLHSLPLNLSVTVNGRDYLLVHGAPEEWYRPDNDRYDNKTEFAVWERLKSGDWTEENRTLIFGHTPTIYYQKTYPFELWREGNMVGIDCGCAYGSQGRLGCLRLDDGRVFYSQSEEKPHS